MKWRRVGEEELQHDHSADAQGQIAIAHVSGEGKRRIRLVSAVEKIEHLSDDESVDRDRSCELIRSILRLHPEERRHRDREQRDAYKADAPNRKAIQQRMRHGSWGSRHHVALVWLEGNDETQSHRGHHIYP